MLLPQLERDAPVGWSVLFLDFGDVFLDADHCCASSSTHFRCTIPMSRLTRSGRDGRTLVIAGPETAVPRPACATCRHGRRALERCTAAASAQCRALWQGPCSAALSRSSMPAGVIGSRLHTCYGCSLSILLTGGFASQGSHTCRDRSVKTSKPLFAGTPVYNKLTRSCKLVHTTRALAPVELGKPQA